MKKTVKFTRALRTGPLEWEGFEFGPLVVAAYENWAGRGWHLFHKETGYRFGPCYPRKNQALSAAAKIHDWPEWGKVKRTGKGFDDIYVPRGWRGRVKKKLTSAGIPT